VTRHDAWQRTLHSSDDYDGVDALERREFLDEPVRTCHADIMHHHYLDSHPVEGFSCFLRYRQIACTCRDDGDFAVPVPRLGLGGRRDPKSAGTRIVTTRGERTGELSSLIAADACGENLNSRPKQLLKDVHQRSDVLSLREDDFGKAAPFAAGKVERNKFGLALMHCAIVARDDLRG
jgi:hypothetical protein